MPPFQDVADVLLDSDFADTISATRTVTTVGPTGETTATPTTVSGIIAVVQPANSNELQRLPETERLKGAITIWTTYRLHSGGLLPDGVTNATADVVGWQGRQWSVFSIEDWTRFGAGYVRATATMLDLI